jgi:hypothetical protein
MISTWALSRRNYWIAIATVFVLYAVLAGLIEDDPMTITGDTKFMWVMRLLSSSAFVVVLAIRMMTMRWPGVISICGLAPVLIDFRTYTLLIAGNVPSLTTVVGPVLVLLLVVVILVVGFVGDAKSE